MKDDRDNRYGKDREQADYTDYDDYDTRYRPLGEERPRFDEETGEPLDPEIGYGARDAEEDLSFTDKAVNDRAKEKQEKHAEKDDEKKRPTSKAQGHSFQDKKTPVKVLGMIGAAIVLVLVILGIISIVTFFKDRSNHQLTPRRTAEAMIEAVSHDDYERFQSLYPGKEALGPEASRQVYQEIRESLHRNAVTSDYVLIRQQNGRDILIAMEYNKSTNQYEIFDVQIVPAEDKEIFVY